MLLDKELETFQNKLPELLTTHKDEFVLIKNETIVDFFITERDGIRAGYKLFQGQPFFVKQILPFEEPITFGGGNLFL